MAAGQARGRLGAHQRACDGEPPRVGPAPHRGRHARADPDRSRPDAVVVAQAVPAARGSMTPHAGSPGDEVDVIYRYANTGTGPARVTVRWTIDGIPSQVRDAQPVRCHRGE